MKLNVYDFEIHTFILLCNDFCILKTRTSTILMTIQVERTMIFNNIDWNRIDLSVDKLLNNRYELNPIIINDI